MNNQSLIIDRDVDMISYFEFTVLQVAVLTAIELAMHHYTSQLLFR